MSILIIVHSRFLVPSFIHSFSQSIVGIGQTKASQSPQTILVKARQGKGISSTYHPHQRWLVFMGTCHPKGMQQSLIKKMTWQRLPKVVILCVHTISSNIHILFVSYRFVSVCICCYSLYIVYCWCLRLRYLLNDGRFVATEKLMLNVHIWRCCATIICIFFCSRDGLIRSSQWYGLPGYLS